MSDLTSRILELIARLGSREDLGLSPPRPLNRTAMEAAYRHALRTDPGNAEARRHAERPDDR